MRTLFIALFILFIHNASFSKVPNFGKDGLAGLTLDQKVKLVKDGIIAGFSDNNKKNEKNSFIEAAVIFNQSIEITWKLLSKTENQPLYLEESKEIKVVSKKDKVAVEVQTTGNWLIKLVYGVIEYHDPANYALHWTLDASHPNNGLNYMNGYWQLFPYGKNQTLYRYGSSVSVKNIPDFIENRFKEKGVNSAMAATKKYVDSCGTYRK